jgi:tRNA pseudouridine synthase 10
LPEAVQKYHLCETCLRRQGGRPGDFGAARDDECYICRGLVRNVDVILAKTVKDARPYEFGTFAVGLTMPEGVQEREDELRSTMRMKGRETIKVQLSTLIATGVSRVIGKRVDKAKPDLTLIADLSTLQVRMFSRPLFFYGRYTKPAGAAQRREWCSGCRGKGCEKCELTGFNLSPSVEGSVRGRLSECGSDSMTFTWIGSEDRESEVMPPGRPFVVEVKNPVKRRLPKRFAVRFKGGQVKVNGGRILPSRPRRLPGFRFRTRIFARTSTPVKEDSLKELRSRFKDATVRFNRPYDRPTLKKVHRVSAKAKGRSLVIDAELDGGLPVKRFVSGDLVSPSVSEVLKTEVSCRKFDIRRVIETSGFEFA